ncbi:MAG: FtsX-like permease family protein [Thiohalomonadales bacterium]
MNLWKATLRHYTRHPWQILLSILGIAMGVAVVVAIDLTNSSADNAFKLSSQAISGLSTHQIIGGQEGLPEKIYVRQRVKTGFRMAAPMVEGYGNYLGANNQIKKTFRIMGVDIFAEQGFRDYLFGGKQPLDLDAFVAGGNTAVVLKSTAEKYGLKVNKRFQLQVLGVKYNFLLVGVVEAKNKLQRLGLESILFMDISTAQELLEMQGRLSKIDLILPEHSAAQLSRQMEKRLPANAVIVSSKSRHLALQQMTHAFQLNLFALSMMALLVGIFLIYNTMTFSVVQRRDILGYLRTLGVTRKQIFILILTEALLVSSIATAVGIGLGILLATNLIHLVTQTINDLYFVLTVNELDVSTFSIIKGVLIGLLGSMCAVIFPAYEATKSTPKTTNIRSNYESNYKHTVKLSFFIGIAIGTIGYGLLVIPSTSLVLSFIAMLVIIIGFTMLVPQLTLWLVSLVAPLMRMFFGELGNLSARGVVSTFSRSGVAVTSLSVAIATTVGVAIMITSFRTSVENWLDTTLQADVYISRAGEVGHVGQAAMPELWVGEFSELPEVESISISRQVQVQSSKGVTQLHVYDVPSQHFDEFTFVEGDAKRAKSAYISDHGLLISEPYSYRNGLKVGDELLLTTAQGQIPFPIVGVYRDYGSEKGVVTINRASYLKFWDDETITSLGVYANPGIDPEVLVSKLEDIVNQQYRNPTFDIKRQDLSIRSNKAVKEASISVFERSFSITHVLRVLAITVAFVGILSALMSIMIERSKELALLRAIGLTPRQVWWVISGETGLMGAMAGILALPLGLILASILIYVINQRSFGWSMEMNIEPFVIVQAVVLAITAAIIAGILPAIRMSSVEPARLLREE